MVINWRAILSGLLGGAVAAWVAGYAVTTVLHAASGAYSTGDMVRAGAVALGGGVLGTLLGWLGNGRRASGLSGIAAIVSFVGAVWATVAWVRVVGPTDETGLYVVGAIILLGVALVALVAVCGLTVALLRPASAAARPATDV
ncbi:hypothetical protein [Ornithinimicrobium avium]|uniref:Uncharacterized protein n=1 Tax=Ornithinimicrobium avium TaxID=2283195 RepID=A0A345NQG6_9MICO|nr:hypothetical protein [Ornithinimicrobium avium]AXH97274.1 hypothetical protein DV701_15160 [Ornithinimicrobium avium]